MKKIIIVFGTRPEAIKMAPLVIELKKNKDIKTLTCVTAQHREMLDQVLRVFDVKPEIDLDIMKKDQDLCDVTSNIIHKLKECFLEEKPDLVLVHGDTTTSFVAALVCFYLGIKVGHVEAGLRTNNLYAPFPEEFNRQVTGIISNLHFAPTQASAANLLREGKNKDNIFVTGNTVIDSMQLVLKRINEDTKRLNKITSSLKSSINFNWEKEKFVLITGHRRENFGQGFKNICESIKKFCQKYEDVHFIYPVHLNPNVRKPVNSILSEIKNISLVEPLDYENFVYLMSFAYLVLTDSGGIQEEAPSLGIPVLVMRDETERPEALEAGTVMLTGTSKDSIFTNLEKLFNDKKQYKKMSKSTNPYGDGKASKRIVKIIKKKIYEI